MAALLAYLFYLSSSTASKLQRRHIAIRRSNDEGQIDFALKVMAITFVLSFSLLFFKNFTIKQSPTEIAGLALICGVFGAFAWAAQYIAQRHVEAGVTSLLGNSYAPVSILLASMFLSETLSLRQAAGTILLFGAAVMVSKQHRISRWRFDRYFWLNVMAGAALAFTLTAERALIKYNGLAGGTIISWGAQVMVLAIAATIAGSKSQ